MHCIHYIKAEIFMHGNTVSLYDLHRFIIMNWLWHSIGTLCVTLTTLDEALRLSEWQMRECAQLNTCGGERRYARTDLPEDHSTSALRLVAGTSSSVARANTKLQKELDCGSTFCLTLNWQPTFKIKLRTGSGPEVAGNSKSLFPNKFVLSGFLLYVCAFS